MERKIKNHTLSVRDLLQAYRFAMVMRKEASGTDSWNEWYEFTTMLEKKIKSLLKVQE